VVRIREEPLQPLCHHDVQVPARNDPKTCAQAVLIHLMHVLYPEFPGRRDEDRVTGFLKSAARPLAPSDLRCDDCREVAAWLLSATQPVRATSRTAKSR
jgi:hypothetical protein